MLQVHNFYPGKSARWKIKMKLFFQFKKVNLLFIVTYSNQIVILTI